MHDAQYRAEVARQNTTYNQPSYTGFYFASDMDFTKVPLPSVWTPGSIADLQSRLDRFIESGDVSGPVAKQLSAILQPAVGAINRGDGEQSGPAIERFLAFLEQQKQADQVSESARETLVHHASSLLKMLGR